MTAINVPLQTAPWFGRKWEHSHAIIAGIGSLFLCYLASQIE